ncbi:Fanconi anemia group M protein-like [Mercenaria mercenaria]|uniref:Fanconi anemia group M protein-like n=1 Tax=Mercenaria mercenaria TaxID=6596 RepID=UPI00234E3C56|nr:Fanconi anemia group M protein-like [Mercenaria mercenaria]
MSKKQATLFQSWRNKSKGPEQGSVQSVCQPSTVSADNDVIDLCGSFEDEDDNLLCEAEESVTNISKHLGPAATSHKIFPKNKEHAHACENFEGQHVGDISIGADGFTPTQAQTQSFNIPGFDKCAGKLWIYPTNYPVREYQFSIVQQALFKNTMVTLPTGLGKTFIAAVVMYNFYRWYPQGKVIFMAPTKPLVAQQIEACYNIMGIPQDHTAEMTGSMGPSKRERAWHDKRVFFLTPQVLTNDLSRGSCPAEDVKCLVIDEAHKALGNHAYCQVVRELVKYTENFRILSLSATPGSDIKAVQQVLNNLLISQIEIRTEDSIDIKRYSHERKVDKVVVPLGDELTKVKTKYIQIMEVVVNRLKRHGVLYNKDTTSLSKFLILKAREAFRQNPPERLQRNQYGIVEGDFALAMSLYHGYELLQLHGSRSLYNFLEGILTGDKGYGRTRTELTRNADFNELMGLLSGKYTAPESETASQARAKPFVIGHPKMVKLQEIVLDHFNTHSDAGTRVMIFSQYRDSVQEITDMLHVHQPVVKVMSFIGQATAGKSTKGFTQKEQLKVMKQFREGGYNTLVSTCVGEEGLDIGDVDLIICFDAHKSPIRLVQRMGRTGRKREGRIVMLVTQGKEEQIYNQSQYSKKSIHKAILNGAKSLHFYQHSPRMVPENLTPSCHKMHITVKENFKPTKKITADKDLNQSKITTMMHDAASKKNQSDEIITLEEYRELEPWLVPEEDVPKLPSCRITCLEKEDSNELQGKEEDEWLLGEGEKGELKRSKRKEH